jgi:hypothetical protein
MGLTLSILIGDSIETPILLAGSQRVLATVMDDIQESLLALAPTTSLCPWVQQGLGVTLVTDAHTHLHAGKTTAHHSSDVLFIALDPLWIPA